MGAATATANTTARKRLLVFRALKTMSSSSSSSFSSSSSSRLMMMMAVWVSSSSSRSSASSACAASLARRTATTLASSSSSAFSPSSSSGSGGGGGGGGGSIITRAYAKAAKKASKAGGVAKKKTTKNATTGGGAGKKKGVDDANASATTPTRTKRASGVRTDAPPKVEKVHVLPHLPVVSGRNVASNLSSSGTGRAATTAGAHRTDAPPKVDKVTVLPHLPARADGGWIAPSSSSSSSSSATMKPTTKTVGAAGAASGKGASSGAAFNEQKQHQQQNVNAEGLDFSTVASALAGMAIVVGGIYSVVSSSSSGRESAKNKNKKAKDGFAAKKKNIEELNDVGHHEPLLTAEEEKPSAQSTIENKANSDSTSVARKEKTKKEEEEERLAEDLLIQKLREDAAKLVEEEFTKAFVPDASTSSNPTTETGNTATSSSSSSSREEASRPPLYDEKEVAKELAEVFEAANELLMKNMDSAEAPPSNQEQEQLKNNNTETSKLDRALDELALAQANVQALEMKMREMERQHAEDLEKSKREHALRAEETVLSERAKRLKQLDEERIKFGALKTVLSERRKTLEDAKTAHEIVAAVSKLSEKIEKGESFAREMQVLKKVAENDDVLRALLSGTERTLEKLATKDVPTLVQLRDSFEKQVKKDARRVYLIPKEGGGMLAYAVASLASLIKVEEAGGKENCISLEAAIAQVETLLRDDCDSVGNAARILLEASEHSKAKDVVQSWATSAMEREEIDFILRSLVAHANAKSSGV